jgi:hypothetical protein
MGMSMHGGFKQLSGWIMSKMGQDVINSMVKWLSYVQNG